MDFSSSSGEEGVLTISGVRLKDWEKQNKTKTQHNKPDIINGVKQELSNASVVFVTEGLLHTASTNE